MCADEGFADALDISVGALGFRSRRPHFERPGFAGQVGYFGSAQIARGNEALRDFGGVRRRTDAGHVRSSEHSIQGFGCVGVARYSVLSAEYSVRCIKSA